MNKPPPLIHATQLTYGTPTGKALASELTFQLHAGQILIITGPNGSGKSTLLKVLMGQVRPFRGRCEVTVSRKKIGFLPQLQNTEFHLPLTLLDVLEISAGNKIEPREIIEIGLLDRAHLQLAWNTASGGERKRTLLTRLLLQKPSLLLLDEPMNHLDTESRKRVQRALSEYLSIAGPIAQAGARNSERAIALVSHDKALASGLSAGKIVPLALGEAT